MGHVTDRVDVDQKAHASDDQDHHAAERVEQVTPVSGEVDQSAGRGGRLEPGEPGELHDLVRMALDAPQLEDRAGGKDERQQHRAGADETDELLAGGVVVSSVAMRVLRIQAASEEQHDHRPDEREHGDEPDAIEEEHLTSASFQLSKTPTTAGCRSRQRARFPCFGTERSGCPGPLPPRPRRR